MSIRSQVQVLYRALCQPLKHKICIIEKNGTGKTTLLKIIRDEIFKHPEINLAFICSAHVKQMLSKQGQNLILFCLLTKDVLQAGPVPENRSACGQKVQHEQVLI